MFGREITISFENVDIEPISNLRIQFRADKSDGQNLNRAQIVIYNLNASSRAALTVARPITTVLVDPVKKVHLFAGYEGNVTEVIAGDIYIANSRRIGTDWITTIEVLSGISAATKSQSNVSFDGSTNALFIASQLIEPMGLSIEYTAEAREILTKTTYEDFSESSNTLKSITNFLRRFDIEFTIEEDNKGLIYKSDSPRELDRPQDDANTFNQGNGLIGSPIVTTTGVEILALLRPGIRILQAIYVGSQTIQSVLQSSDTQTNQYFVKNIRHFGDTHEDEWFTEIEAFYADITEIKYAS